MSPEEKASPPRTRPTVLSPWVAVMGGLALYGLTLNHWVTLQSLRMVAQVTGWDWHPLPLPWREEPMAPLFLAVTAPVRLLSSGWQPLALNVLTAICAALTLGLLAASVRLLPHDRTPAQRLGEIGEHGLLAIRAAYLPALFAVLMLAGQWTFWQNAVAATGDMLNVLLFAFVIFCLLQYRICREDKWLLVSAFVYGLGDTNDWAFAGFFPLYVIALIWVRRVPSSKILVVTTSNLINVLWGRVIKNRFLWRMICWGLLGHLLYLLIPLIGAVSGGGGFFYLLLHQWGIQRHSLLHLVPRWVVFLASGCTLAPLLLTAIRWPTYHGEHSAAGNTLNRFMLHFLHLGCLGLALVMFFDFKYSPSLRMREQPTSFLTFYYMAALCVGYYSGYVLLVFGSGQIKARERRRPAHKMMNCACVSLVWLLAAGSPALAAWHNFPRFQAARSGALDQYAGQMLAGLPANKAIVLSDNPGRLCLLEAACQRRGIRNSNILIETESFPHREYICYLAARHPDLGRAFATNLSRLPRVLPIRNLVLFMALSTTNFSKYYLHPSIGYLCDALYLKPRGVVYELKPITTSQMQPPLESDAEIAANQAFWSKLESGPLQLLPALAEWDPDAAAVSADYSAAIDYWATELQEDHHFKEAREQFAGAIRLNTNNFIAQINLEYNQRLLKGDHRPVDSREVMDTGIRLYRGLAPMLRQDGPADEPGLELIFGEAMAASGEFGQAARMVDRHLQLLPGDPEGELAMAKIYVALRQPAKALALVRQLRGCTNISAWESAHCEALACIASQDYVNAEKVLRDAIRQDPGDERRVAALADYYRGRALAELREHKEGEAARHFAAALTNINLRLRLIGSPSRDSASTADAAEALLQKAKVETMLKSYSEAAATLGEALRVQPDNYVVLLNHAAAETRIKQFQMARDDYKKLRKLLPDEPYVIDLGLAEIAAAETNTAEEVAQLKRCLKSAPEDSGAYVTATQWLAKLQAR